MTSPKRVERAQLYFPGQDGAVVTVAPVDGRKFKYEELREAVGGMIESIRPAIQGHAVWANEEGLLLGLKPNHHTWEAANKKIYLLNGYDKDWRIVGRILEVYKVELAASGRAELPTIELAVKADFVQRRDALQHDARFCRGVSQ